MGGRGRERQGVRPATAWGCAGGRAWSRWCGRWMRHGYGEPAAWLDLTGWTGGTGLDVPTGHGVACGQGQTGRARGISGHVAGLRLRWGDIGLAIAEAG